MRFHKYAKFPKLKRFFELGGDHTPEGEKYLRENPTIYNEAREWDYFFQLRIILGNDERIHKIDSER